MTSWPYVFAFLASYIAGVHIALRHLPIIHVDTD
eukprot:SAG22_NODE_1331_length_4702_cov_2.662177_7_plen_33_part_01